LVKKSLPVHRTNERDHGLCDCPLTSLDAGAFIPREPMSAIAMIVP